MRTDLQKKGAASIFLAAVFFAACTKQPASNPQLTLPERGKQVYMANCIACHNPDPTKDGAVGPAVAGSSLELLKARVLEGSYPPGYQPKRQSKAMSALPQLKDQIEALHAFLNTK